MRSLNGKQRTEKAKGFTLSKLASGGLHQQSRTSQTSRRWPSVREQVSKMPRSVRDTSHCNHHKELKSNRCQTNPDLALPASNRLHSTPPWRVCDVSSWTFQLGHLEVKGDPEKATPPPFSSVTSIKCQRSRNFRKESQALGKHSSSKLLGPSLSGTATNSRYHRG